MIDLTKIINTLEHQFQKLTKIDSNIYRGENIYEGKLYSISYFDFRDDVIGLAQELNSFQEKFIGAEFFELPNDLRWSTYLYVLAGSESIKKEGFSNAKSVIEENRDYARKFVLSEEELFSLLNDSKLFTADNDIKTVDVTAAWERHLNDHQLNILLDKPARSKAIEQIEKGQASRTDIKPREYILSSKDIKLTEGFLRSLEVEAFRPVHDGESYSFADVNLIVGPNGSGKTSLLEAIEYLYCGHNRRDDTHGPRRLTGKIQLADDEHESVSSTNDASRLKARNFTWYRKENHQSKSILDGFTKYNFLDTDAAFRISTELEPASLNDDLRRLLVGSDASTLWDYLEKVMEDLTIKIKDQNLHLILHTQRHDALKKELEVISQAPSQASSLSKTYRALLRELNWKGKEANIDEVVSEKERLNIEACANALNRIRANIPTHLATRGHIKNLLKNLKHFQDSAKLLEAKRVRNIEVLGTKGNKLTQAELESANLKEWSSYCISDAPKRLRSINEWQRKVEVYKRQLGPMATINAPEVPEQYNGLSLDHVDAIVFDLIKNIQEELQTAEIAQKNIESLQQSLSLLRRQLQEAARQIVIKSGQNELCPVCETPHTSVLLNSKIEALSGKETEANIAELALRIQAAKNREAEIIKIKNDITILRKIAINLNLNPSLTSANGIRDSLVNLQKELVNSVESLREAEGSVKNLDLIGMSQDRYTKLRQTIETLFEESDDIESLELLNVASKKLESDIIIYREQLIQLNAELKEVSIELQKLLHDAPISSSSKNANIDEISKILEEELQQLQHTDTLLEQISTLIEFSDNHSILEIETAMTAAIDAFDHAWHASQNELNANLSRRKITDEYEKADRDIKIRKDSLHRLKDANNALKKLKTEYSLSNATDNVLALIGQQINEVFGRIHSPREYEFSNTSNSILVTRDENMARSLEQISTGQRAAFALSIFLALNTTALSAPPILLIDDPIAHIDDLNALSFLDYLRDLSLHSRRQIFFATADTRVAALFDKKFSFLGQKKYQRIQLGPRST